MAVFRKLLSSKTRVKSSRGESVEIDGILLELTNPRSRLSRTENRGTIFSCLGEWLWYVSGSDKLDFIEYYISHYRNESEDGLTLYGAYGPRIFGKGTKAQIENVLSLLGKKKTSRRAVVQIFDSKDLVGEHKEIPCTCIWQFLVRDNQLHMYTYMRSNDAYYGLPHDIFAFTMIQELVANSLGVGLGSYKHSVGSLHLYMDFIEKANEYLDEGWQDLISMPEMPAASPWNDLKKVLDAEQKLRCKKDIDIDSYQLDSYWLDLIYLLDIYKNIKEKKLKEVARRKNRLSSNVYETYIRRKTSASTRSVPEQLDLIK